MLLLLQSKEILCLYSLSFFHRPQVLLPETNFLSEFSYFDRLQLRRSFLLIPHWVVLTLKQGFLPFSKLKMIYSSFPRQPCHPRHQNRAAFLQISVFCSQSLHQHLTPSQMLHCPCQLWSQHTHQLIWQAELPSALSPRLPRELKFSALLQVAYALQSPAPHCSLPEEEPQPSRN